MNRSRRRDRRKPGSMVWADKLYDTADFVAGCRERGCTRRSRRTTPSPPLGDRWPHDPPCWLRHQHDQAESEIPSLGCKRRAHGHRFPRATFTFCLSGPILRRRKFFTHLSTVSAHLSANRAFECCADQHQHAFGGFFHSGLQVEPIRPHVHISPCREIALLPLIWLENLGIPFPAALLLRPKK